MAAIWDDYLGLWFNDREEVTWDAKSATVYERVGDAKMKLEELKEKNPKKGLILVSFAIVKAA